MLSHHPPIEPPVVGEAAADADQTARRPARFTAAAAGAIAIVSVCFRFLWLDRLPGINGDEAWYGVQVLHFLNGQPWLARTPSGLPINPLLLATHAAILHVAEPSFWLLRLPIAVWSGVALVLTYRLHTWVFGDRVQGLIAAALVGCLPMHLAYSRLCWDPSFGLVTAPLVIYSCLKLCAQADRLRAAAVFAAGTVLSVWVHVTNFVLVAACLAILAWQFRATTMTWLRRRPITAAAIVATGLAAATTLACRSGETEALVVSVLSTFNRLPAHLVALGDILVGLRVYEYLAGTSTPAWMRTGYWVVAAVLAVAVASLFRRSAAQDRNLAALAVVTLAMVLAVGRRLDIDDRSCERYVVYVVPLVGVLIVRGSFVLRDGVVQRLAWPAAPLLLAALLLFQFWVGYFEPLRRGTYGHDLHRTFWTGPREPKAELVKAIRSRLRGAPPTDVYVEDWWIGQPVEYLLGGNVVVNYAIPPATPPRPTLVAGFTGSPYLREVEQAAADRGQPAERMPLDPDAPRVVSLIALAPSAGSGPYSRSTRQDARDRVLGNAATPSRTATPRAREIDGPGRLP
jgi:hypothetical protein